MPVRGIARTYVQAVPGAEEPSRYLAVHVRKTQAAERILGMTRRTVQVLAQLVLHAALAGFATHASAASLQASSGEKRVTLVELYTSEGCSSCPPAEAWMNQLQDDPRLWREIVPVAFHVDYWDYIGWPDRFAVPAHSATPTRISPSTPPQ